MHNLWLINDACKRHSLAAYSEAHYFKEANLAWLVERWKNLIMHACHRHHPHWSGVHYLKNKTKYTMDPGYTF